MKAAAVPPVGKQNKNVAAGSKDDDDDDVTAKKDDKTTKKDKKNKKTKGTTTSSKQASTATKKKNQPVTAKSHPRYVRRIGGHSGSINSICISPSHKNTTTNNNGDWIATSGTDGILRVTNISSGGGGGGGNSGEALLSLSCVVQSDKTLGNFKDQLTCLNWSSEDDRTVVGIMKNAKCIAFYRMRKKKTQQQMDDNTKKSSTKNPFELIELIKRRIPLEQVLGDDTITSCLIDQTHSKYCLLITGSDSKHNNVITWNGNDGTVVGGSAATHTSTIVDGNDNKLRLSLNGQFICTRVEGESSQVKIYELHKSKVKGEVEPIFDKIPAKGVMTITPPKSSNAGKIADVAFLCIMGSGNTYDVLSTTSTLAVLGSVNGIIQIWNLNVEYQNQQDPILLVSYRSKEVFGDTSSDSSKQITLIEATTTTASSNTGSTSRIAVATNDGALHLFTYKGDSKKNGGEIVYDFTIDDPHPEDQIGGGIGDMQFCCCSSSNTSATNTIYTRGKRSKDVHCWNIS